MSAARGSSPPFGAGFHGRGPGPATGPPLSTGERRLRLAGRLLLAALLSALLLAALTHDRGPVPRPVGDEATYVMQALSLVHDLDLVFDGDDFARFRATWGAPPDRLALASRDGGEHVAFGTPYLYAVVVAPLVAVMPVRGAAVANALLLALAAWLAGRALERRVGAAAWLWTAVFCFASVVFRYTFFALPEIFLLTAVVAGLALACGGAPVATVDRRGDEPDEVYGGAGAEPSAADPAEAAAAVAARRRRFGRWLAVGALLAVPAVFRPIYAALLPAAVLLAPRGRRARAAVALAAGALAVVALAAAGQRAAGGGWTVYSGRHAFYAASGYPGVDFPAAEWPGPSGRPSGAVDVAPGTAAPRLDARLWGWNAVYFLAGRNGGVLPYFLPLLLLLAGADLRSGRWALLTAVAVAVAALLFARPFGFAGGAEAVGNRYFLPLYGALWLLPGHRPRPLAGTLAALGVTGLAALWLWPSWTAPRAYPLAGDGQPRHVSALACDRLPLETTRRRLPGSVDARSGDLVLRLIGGTPEPPDPRSGLVLYGSRRAELVVYSRQPLERLSLVFGPRAPSRLEVQGVGVGDTLLRGDGSVGFQLLVGEPAATHPVWWSREPYRVYRLRLGFPDGVPREYAFTATAGGW